MDDTLVATTRSDAQAYVILQQVIAQKLNAGQDVAQAGVCVFVFLLLSASGHACSPWKVHNYVRTIEYNPN